MNRHWPPFPVLLLPLFVLLIPQVSKAFESAVPWNIPDKHRPALDVPYVPTPQDVVDEMLNMADVAGSDILYDLGCGDGRIVVTAAKERHVRKAIGVDLDPARVEESNLNAQKAGVGEAVVFRQKDLFQVNLSDATVVSLYLLPSVNLKLRPKLLKEVKPGTRIVSHDFNMGDWQPDREVRIREHSLFLWIVPASVNGDWKWRYSAGNRTHACRLRLRQHFQTVYKAELYVDGIETEVGNVRLSGNKIEFTVQQGMRGFSGPVRFKGAVHGDTITGRARGEKKASGGAAKWAAQRKPGKAIPVDGASATAAEAATVYKKQELPGSALPQRPDF